MQIHVSDDIRMKKNEVPNELYEVIVGALTIDNPDYKKAEKYGYGNPNMPRYIKLYKEQDGMLVVPRGMGKTIFKFLKVHEFPFQMKDDRVLLQKVEFESHIKLRDYQEQAVNQILKGTQGFLVSPCGSGKTVMMVEMMTRIKQPTLFIVHQKELMEQIIQTAVNLTDITRDEVGVIGAGKKSIGERMTVATIQTLNRIDIEGIKDKFGVIFIDEAHHLAAKSFYEVISKFGGCYRLAVSATPERADGLTQMVYACTGGIVHEIKQDVVPTIIPRLQVVKTSFSTRSSEHKDIISALVNDKARNRMIADMVREKASGNYTLVLSDRVEHLKKLKELIDDDSLRTAILTGSMKKSERAEIMKSAKNKEIDVLLATQLAREGLDIPHLNQLFLTFPKKSGASIQQEVGRIMRPCEKKQDAVVYDFMDDNGILRNQFRQRKEIYEKLGMSM